jgi:hypothetical protein
VYGPGDIDNFCDLVPAHPKEVLSPPAPPPPELFPIPPPAPPPATTKKCAIVESSESKIFSVEDALNCETWHAPQLIIAVSLHAEV